MNDNMMKILPNFLSALGLDEEPMGIFYTDEKPIEGFSPKPNELPTREKEMKNEIDWHRTNFVLLNRSVNSQMMKCRN
jgi:hypothetical protein